MGVPLILPAAAAAGLSPTALAAAAGLASQGINAISQGSLNRKTRQWNEAMYQKQRTDALADWARTNEYNAPLQQMARLKAAGLSPTLFTVEVQTQYHNPFVQQIQNHGRQTHHKSTEDK